MTGHLVVIEASLMSEAEGGLRGPILDGHRSVAYEFESLDGSGVRVAFGAHVEKVVEGGEPGERMVAVLRFYHDLAEVYATPGVECLLEYGRPVGRGLIVEVLPAFDAEKPVGEDVVDDESE